MNARNRRHLALATEIARKTVHDSPFHLAAVLNNGKNILSVGVNFMRKTHTKSNTRHKFLHAEMDSIIGVRKEHLKGATLYVSRVGYDHRERILFSKPCGPCQLAIIRAGIKEVWYTITDITVGHWNVRRNTWIEYPADPFIRMKVEIQHADTTINTNSNDYSRLRGTF